MTIAIVTDVHANRHALEAVFEDVAEHGCEEVWCLGDLVGYGAEPDACVALIRERADLCLCGNHDLGVVGRLEIERFSDVARTAAEWTRATINQETFEFLAALEPKDEDQPVGLYHASPRDPVWEYVLSPLQAELCFELQPRRVSLIGHSHVALAYHRADGEMATGETRHEGETLNLSEGFWLVNPGSVGQPRDGDPRAAWLELDLEQLSARYHRVPYDIEGAAWEIRAARLPEILAERLSHGQ